MVDPVSGWVSLKKSVVLDREKQTRYNVSNLFCWLIFLQFYCMFYKYNYSTLNTGLFVYFKWRNIM